MSEEQKVLEDIRRELAALPQADRNRVMAIAEILRDAIRSTKPHGYMAIGLVGAEVAAGEG